MLFYLPATVHQIKNIHTTMVVTTGEYTLIPAGKKNHLQILALMGYRRGNVREFSGSPSVNHLRPIIINY